jgi:hypothetical protein
VLALAAALAGGATACSAGSSNDNSAAAAAAAPAAVTYADPVNPGYAHINGETFCVYVSVPQECQMSGLPLTQWISVAQLQNPTGYSGMYDSDLPDLLTWYLTWHLWFDSPRYYNTYIVHNHYVPAAARTAAYSTYRTRTTSIDNTYHSRESTLDRQASYTVNGKTVTGTQAAKMGVTVRNTGGSRSATSLCAMISGPNNTTKVVLTAYVGKGPSSSGGKVGGNPAPKPATGNNKPVTSNGNNPVTNNGKPRTGSGAPASGGNVGGSRNSGTTSKAPCG